MMDEVLRMYEPCTGQLINPDKCSIMFGADCAEADQEAAKSVLRVNNVAVGKKYLGLPTPEVRMNKGRFKSLKQRFTKRFTNWAERNMSSGVNEVLIKSVGQAIPTYSMGGFKLLVMFCDDLIVWFRISSGEKKRDTGRCTGSAGRNC
jgi:hypothetical protein